MIERRKPPVDIECTQCRKPMVMMKFNWTTLERGFESISLRCQYCKCEETRPFPPAEPVPSVDARSALNEAQGAATTQEPDGENPIIEQSSVDDETDAAASTEESQS